MKISEAEKTKLFSVKSMVKMYARTDADFGRYCRGVHQGIILMMIGLGITADDIVPELPPFNPSGVYKAFCAIYGAFLGDEGKPRLDKNSPDHKMLYGPDAQDMMKEAEEHLKTIQQRKKGRDN